MHALLSTLPIAGILLFAACENAEHEKAEHHDPMNAMHAEMMKTDSAAKAQEAMVTAINDRFNSNNMEGIEDLMTADVVDHQMDPSIKTTGIQSIKDLLNMYHTAFPDVKQEILGMATKGDRTYFQIHMTGTNTGPWGDMPATGKVMDVMGCDVMRFENGKAAEHWGYTEEAKMMMQLGLMPPPAAPKKK
ncbi:MAG: ester cyclase [Flavobacteriales bacterium]|nr:ester cyclase [Flavobacteriales bacterium]